MVSFIYLETALDALDDAKNNCEYQHQDCHPEVVPLHAVAAIVPPLGKGHWGGISLFEDHEPVPPEPELFNLA